MKIGVLFAIGFTLVSIPASVLAAPPANDKFSKAKALTGTSGIVSSTNVEATFEDSKYERSDFGQQLKQTVWYSYKAPADGYLQITLDLNNSGGGVMVVAPFRIFPSGSYTFFNEVASSEYVDVTNGKRILVTPFTKGNLIKFQFDTSTVEGTSAAGTFGFQYAFITGAAFQLEDAPHPVGRIFSWREDEAGIEIVVARTNSTTGTATVDYELAGDDGDVNTDLTTGGDDFTGTLTFAPGEGRKTLFFPINNDMDTEGTETFTFVLSNPGGEAVVLDRETDLTIEDNEGAPANDNFADATVVTGDTVNQAIGAGLATIEVNEPENLTQTVWYSWVAPSTGVASITNDGGLSLAVFTGGGLTDLTQVRPVDPDNPPNYVFPGGILGGGDFVVESGVTYHIVIGGYDSAIGAVNFSIAHHSATGATSSSSFRFSETGYEPLESAGKVTITIQRFGNTSQSSTVNFTTSLTDNDPEDAFQFEFSPFATPGTDYTVKTEAITFTAGETEKSVDVLIANQTIKENTEHFFVRLSSGQVDSPVDSPAIAPVRILQKPSTEMFYFHSYDGTPYRGMLQPLTTGGEGTISITLNSSGAFTGTLILDGQKHKFTGSFPALTDQKNVSVSKVINITRTGMADAVLTLNYTVDDNFDSFLTGTVTDGTINSSFTTHAPSFFSSLHIQKLLGKFTVVLTPDSNVPAAIRVPGYLALEVKAKGVVSVLGSLPDGTKVSGSGFLTFSSFNRDDFTDNHEAVFFLPLYKGLGHLSGKLHLAHPGDRKATPTLGDGEGTVRWSHPVLTTGTVLTAFGASMEPYISRYTVPVGGLVLLAATPTPLNIDISGGGLSAITLSGTFGLKSKVTFAAGLPSKPSFSFNAATGLFTGKYTPITPAGSKPLTFQGAVSRNRSTGTGYILNGTNAGTVEVSLP